MSLQSAIPALLTSALRNAQPPAAPLPHHEQRSAKYVRGLGKTRQRHKHYYCMAEFPRVRPQPESGVVADALRSLRPEHRGVLLETCYRGRSVAEAAAVLGIPAGTIKTRTFSALRSLKLALEDRGLVP
jgi:DNA-directed RNA polymerase specialized sigma24 family protein